MEFINILADRLGYNTGRAQNLVNTYDLVRVTIKGNSRGRSPVPIGDILRSAVVFTHASLEDFLRSISARLLPLANPETLNQIPLSGSNDANSKKLLLGQLVAHKGKTVDEVLQESVDSYLLRSNYNNVDQISGLLISLGIGPGIENLRPYFANLEELMQRRHQIVHRADRQEQKGRGKQIAESISKRDVVKWIKTVQVFGIKSISYLMTSKINDSIIRHADAENRFTSDEA